MRQLDDRAEQIGLGHSLFAVLLIGLMTAGVLYPTFTSSTARALDRIGEVQERAGPRRGTRCPTGSVLLRRARTIQKVVDRKPPGTTFCFKSKTYFMRRPIVPKSNDRFVGKYGAVLDGRRSSMAFNSGGYIGGVVIRGLVITHFAPPAQAGYAAVKASGGWKIIDNEISHNANLGLFYEGDSTLVSGNYIHHNTATGLAGHNTTNSVVENNEVAFNGSGAPDNGGSKWGESSGLIIRNNYFHDNNYAGIWLDTNNVNAVVTNNVSSNNVDNGIHDEVNCNSLYQHNTVRNNGGPEIKIVASNGTSVLDNTVGGSITVWHQDRSASSCPGGLANVTVRGNKVDLPGGTTMNDLTGVFVCCGASGNGLSQVKEWNSNTYTATNTTAMHFQYSGTNVGFSGWKSGTGFDGNSSINQR
jgi:Right handed beta helix region